MEASHFDERSFFSAVHASGVRALLIGRRALVLLGLPLLTADYDYWIAIDDIERFNALAAAFQLHPTRTAADARRHGRYVLENDEHVDVLVARSVPTLHGLPVDFEGLWTRRQTIDVGTVPVCIPSLDELILTKQIASRPKDRRRSSAAHSQGVATMIPQAVEAAVSRVVSPDELRLALESTIPAEEREEVLELVRWFTTRYASSESRLAYVRQAVARWQRARTKNIS